MKDLSIITTYYNCSKYILRAINSVYSQQINNINIEYLIIDDCSEDNTTELVIDFTKKYVNDKIEYRLLKTDTNLGCGGARKFGIDNSQGKYLMFLDGDDYYVNQDFIQRAYDTITKYNADIVEYGLIINSNLGDKKYLCVPDKIIIKENPRLAMVLMFKESAIKFNVWTKIINRRIAERIPYSTNREFEDVETIPLWVICCNTIVIMPSCEINYRRSEKSIISTNFESTRLGTVRAIASHFNTWKNDHTILKVMYNRAMMDLKVLLKDKTSDDPLFNEMSILNKYMLSFIYPETYQDLTYTLINIV